MIDTHHRPASCLNLAPEVLTSPWHLVAGKVMYCCSRTVSWLAVCGTGAVRGEGVKGALHEGARGGLPRALRERESNTKYVGCVYFGGGGGGGEPQGPPPYPGRGGGGGVGGV